MHLRPPLGLAYPLSGLCWAVGVFALDGFDSTAGTFTIGGGCWAAIRTMGIELLLRRRDRRRARGTATDDQAG